MLRAEELPLRGTSWNEFAQRQPVAPLHHLLQRRAFVSVTNLFLCHTPLHVLVSLLVAAEQRDGRQVMVIMQDTPGLHALAKQLAPGEGPKLVLLPGAADVSSRWQLVQRQRQNAKLLPALAAGARSIYLFHDLRPESQALLNLRDWPGGNPDFVCLEDGVALYEANDLLPGSLLAILKRKLAFGLDWTHAREIGLHPAISAIRCFYPELIRPNLSNKKVTSLPRRIDAAISEFCQDAPHAVSGERRMIVACPHSASVSREYMEKLVAASQAYCEDHGCVPVFKLHPRDGAGGALIESISPGANVLAQALPLELLVCIDCGYAGVIGARTSALHIIKALSPHSQCVYFEPDDAPGAEKWMRFFQKVGVSRISDVVA